MQNLITTYYTKLFTDSFTINILTTAATNGLSATSQAYLSTSPTTITGISFFAFAYHLANPNQPINVNVSLYNVGNTNNPTTALATVSTTVANTTASFVLHSVNFTNPVVTSGNYALVVENLSSSVADTLAIIVNSAKTNTYGENLSYYKIVPGLTWNTPVSLYGGNYSEEPLIFPIVTYPIATNYTVSPNVLCKGAPISFTNQTNPGFLTNRMYSFYSFMKYFNKYGADSTFEWNFGDGSPLMNSINAQHTYNATGLFTSKLSTKAGFWNACNDSHTSAITVNPIPTNIVINYRDTICQGEADTLTVTGGGLYTYSWSTGFGNPIVVAPSTTSSYTVTAVGSSGCSSSSVATVIVKPKPVASFTTNVSNATVLFSNASTNSTASLWNFGDNSPTSTSQNAIHNYTSPGTYTVTLTVANDCGFTTATQSVNIISVGIDASSSINNINLFPTPTTGTINIQLGTAEKVKLEIFNLIGEVVYTKELNVVSTSIDLSFLNEAIYYAKFSSSNGVLIKQIVVSK